MLKLRIYREGQKMPSIFLHYYMYYPWLPERKLTRDRVRKQASIYFSINCFSKSKVGQLICSVPHRLGSISSGPSMSNKEAKRQM